MFTVGLSSLLAVVDFLVLASHRVQDCQQQRWFNARSLSNPWSHADFVAYAGHQKQTGTLHRGFLMSLVAAATPVLQRFCISVWFLRTGVE